MSGTLDISTEGLLQTGEEAGSCKPAIVIQETNTPIAVAASASNKVVVGKNKSVNVQSASSHKIAAAADPGKEVIRQVDTVVVSGPSSPSSGGVSSWNDLTDKPTEFPPEDHAHAINDVTGLEPRLFIAAGAYTFDIDTANADDGITDPYKFKTANAAYAAAWKVMERLPTGGNSSITLLFADGTYSMDDFSNNFSSVGAPAVFGEAIEISQSALVQCKIIIKAKNAPSVIADGEWALISSAGNYIAEYTAANIANKALVTAAFKVVFYTANEIRVGMGGNFVLDGVAFVFNDNSTPATLFSFAGSQGVNGYALVNCTSWWWGVSIPQGLYDLNAAYSGLTSVYPEAPGSPRDCKPVYLVQSTVDIAGFVTDYYDDTKLININPLYTNNIRKPVRGYALEIKLKIYTAGAIKYALAYFSLNCDAYINLTAGSGCPSGGVLFEYTDNYYETREVSYRFEIYNGSVVMPGVKLSNKGSKPVLLGNSFATINASFTGGTVGRFIQNNTFQAMPAVLSGAGSPEGVVKGYVGDTYQQTNGVVGATLYIKESGSNTNTGWVAVSTAGHTHAMSDVTGLVAEINALKDKSFFTQTDFVFDIDSTNADNGITDPYKFISPLSAYAAIHAMLYRLKPGAANKITLLFGNGSYSLAELHSNFLNIGLSGGSNTVFDGCAVMRAESRFIIKAKNAPSVISNASWSAISSTANYASEFDAATAINVALVQSAFNTKFEITSAGLVAASYDGLVIPNNFTLDGVAFLHTDATYATMSSWNPVMYFDMYGQVGLNGYAVVNAKSYFSGYTASVIDDPHPSNTRYTASPEAYGIPSKPIYFVNGSPATKVAASYYAVPLTWVGVNLDSCYFWSNTHASMFDNFVAIGAASSVNRGFFSVVLGSGTFNIKLESLSVCPSGQVCLTIYGQDYGMYPTVYMYAASTPVLGSLLIFIPEGLWVNLTDSQLLTIFTGGVSGPRKRVSYNAYPTLNNWSSGSPENLLYGSIGDTCQDKTNGWLYRKASGNNTNTGWENTSNTGTLSGIYKFDTGTSAADPSSGKIRFNTASFATVTNLYVSQTTNPGTDAGNFLGTLATGDQIYFQDKSDGTKFGRYRVSGTPTDNGTWWTIPVTVVNNGAGAVPSNNQICNALIYLKGS